jgi:hypothetical protein
MYSESFFYLAIPDTFNKNIHLYRTREDIEPLHRGKSNEVESFGVLDTAGKWHEFTT